MRIVLDTNVLISAFLSRTGTSYQVIELTRTSDMALIMFQAAFQELERVIRYPHLRSHASYSDNQVERFLHGVDQISLWVSVDQTIAAITNGESDNRLLDLAVAGKARYIITGDKRHLPPLRRFQGIEIVSPTEFLALHKSSSI